MLKEYTFDIFYEPMEEGGYIMRITYDIETDALYIRLVEGKYECRTVRLNEEIALNIGTGEKLIGIEILDAKEILGNGQLPQVVLENISLAKAS
jgi:uncharacterized protein YuzE